MHTFGMIGKMTGNGVRIVIDAGNDSGTFLIVYHCLFNAGCNAACSAEEIYVM